MLQIVDVATWYVNRSLRNQRSGGQVLAEMQRLEKHLDGYPQYVGRGYKIVP
jgi:hypothetical protein